MRDLTRVAFLGGIYSNYLALEAALAIIRERGADAVWALGDFGAFGPFPDRSVEILRGANVSAIQGNYEESLSSGADDCHCGYVDPRDNHFAQLSYDYTAANTSAANKLWMGSLPKQTRLDLGPQRALLCHGSPRRINEFLWASTTPRAFRERLLREQSCDLIVCTHTGLHWHALDEHGRGIVNVGALGRPANDGRTEVWIAFVSTGPSGTTVEHVPVTYDHERLAKEMEGEGLPAEFAATIRTGWWTSCLEILPAKERALGRH